MEPHEVYRSPWFDLSGYRAATVKYSDGSKRTVLEHREVMEAHLGRRLTRHELVHHEDEDRSNNQISNLKLTTRAAHASHHASRRQPEYIYFRCPVCKKRTKKLARQVRGNKKKGRAGPFCGRRCAGKRNAQASSRRPVV